MTGDGIQDAPSAKKSKSLNRFAKQRERRLVEYFVVVSSIPGNEIVNKKQDDEENKNGEEKNESDSVSQLKMNDSDEDNEEDEDDEESDEDSEEDDDDNDEFVDDYDFQPVITSRYPLEDHEGNPLHQSVTCFCHPTGSISLRTDPCMPKVHYFVSTGGSGQQLYGTCLTLFEPFVISSKKRKNKEQKQKEVYLAKCICILSNYPYLVAFREFLCQLHQLTKSGEMTLPVERYITNFCAEIPAPPPGSCEVQTTILDSVIKLWSPPHNQPIPWVSLPFSHLFQCLDLENIITVWHALALEHQVLLTSTQLSLLTTCSEIFLSLLFPMRWSHAYIPVLPHFLVPILSAPMPFFCGIDKHILPDAMYDLSKECILVDLDKNSVITSSMTPELPPLPNNLRAALKETLEDKVGMVFREVRCLNKNDDYSQRGINLSPHIKMTADASWESHLCLFDEAFHRYFTPEEARKNLLNGNEAVAGESPANFVTRKDQLISLRTQSKWDAVQEAFLGTYISLLRNYRRFLIFPSKENEGSYGGAGFQSKQFVNAQPFGMQPFLKKLVATQMFDDFITKRLYGSGEADVTFFDQAVVSASKQNHHNGTPVKGFGRLRIGLRLDTSNESTNGPLLQSARIHHKLMTIVPPEASGADLNLPAIDSNTPKSFKGAMLSISYPDDDGLSVGSNSTGTGSLFSFQSEKKQQLNQETNMMGTYTYIYPIFPSKLDSELYGVARPLPSAVLSEFDRQREDAARFRRRADDEKEVPSFNKLGAHNYAENVADPQIATFTVFFVSFTGVVGKELLEISDNPRTVDRTILSNYKPPPRPTFPIPVDNWDETETWGGEIIEFPTYSRSRDESNTENGKNERRNVNDEKEGTPKDGAAVDNEVIDEAKDTNNTSSEIKNNGNDENMPMDDSSDQMKDIPDSDSITYPNDDSTNLSVISDLTDLDKKSEVKSERPQSKKEDKAKDNVSMTVQMNPPRSRFYDALSVLEIEEARETARAQLGLAFEILGMLRQRGLKADPASYQCLIDASGRCGDTTRATKLLSWMHEDGIVADGVVYSCLVSAFSAENAWRKLTGKNEEELPPWANGATVEMDWNKLRKQSYMDKALSRIKVAKDRRAASGEGEMKTKNKIGNKVNQWVQSYKANSDPEVKKKPFDPKKVFPSKIKVKDVFQSQQNKEVDHQVTNNVLMQIMLGENLLELIYPDISIDTENEMCPRCNRYLMDNDVVAGWSKCDSQDYTTMCPNCTQRFVPHFSVQSSSPTFMGSRGPASPLFCERLSPWVLLKELRSVMSDKEGIENILRPEWRVEATKNATLWWNLVLSFMRYRLPFSFLLQGNFQTSLITPTPETEIL